MRIKHSPSLLEIFVQVNGLDTSCSSTGHSSTWNVVKCENSRNGLNQISCLQFKEWAIFNGGIPYERNSQMLNNPRRIWATWERKVRICELIFFRARCLLQCDIRLCSLIDTEGQTLLPTTAAWTWGASMLCQCRFSLWVTFPTRRTVPFCSNLYAQVMFYQYNNKTKREAFTPTEGKQWMPYQWTAFLILQSLWFPKKLRWPSRQSQEGFDLLFRLKLCFEVQAWTETNLDFQHLSERQEFPV